MNQNHQHSYFHQYFASGILESGIVEDGGIICAQQIPRIFKFGVAIFSVVLYLWYCRKFAKQYKFTPEKGKILPSRFEMVYGIVSIITVIVQTYMKVSTKKGLFILNPCHTNLVFVAILMILPTTKNTKLIHLAWEPWIFGPIFALMFPHLYGINQFEIYLYYVQHFLIFPFGQLLLTRRYGGTQFPSLKNQIFGFGTMCLYQFGILTILSDLTYVNLNFTLCHSPADPGYDWFSYGYFFMGQIYLNFSSYVAIIIMWPIKRVFAWLFFKRQSNKVKQ